MKTELVKVEDQKNEISGFVAMVERFATSPEVDVHKLEKIIELQERILDRNAKQTFAANLAKMQAELPEISQDGEIKIKGSVQSKYAKFEDINEAIKPILQKYGFAITFRVECLDNKIKVASVLSHELGHEEKTELILPHETTGNKNAVQAIGSAVSYGKRYTMCALLNISTRNEDDDGVKALQSNNKKQDQPKQLKPIGERLDNAFSALQVDPEERDALLKAYGTDKEMLLKLLSRVHLKQMTFVDLMQKARFILKAIDEQDSKFEKDADILFGGKK